MMTSKILRYICVLLLCSSSVYGLYAQEAPAAPADSVPRQGRVRGIQYVAELDSLLEKPLPLFVGISVSGDLVGAVMAATSAYGQYEAACRVNLRGRYFPVCEVGWGVSDHTDETTALHYKTNAPYFRIGCDYNFARDLRSGNRILGGLRYGFSSFSYDVDGPSIMDPVWGTATPFAYEGLNGNTHWLEGAFGLEAKMWRFFHIGWTIRYRVRIADKKSPIGRPWYVPGYGKNEGHVISGTFNFVFDI